MENSVPQRVWEGALIRATLYARTPAHNDLDGRGSRAVLATLFCRRFAESPLGQYEVCTKAKSKIPEAPSAKCVGANDSPVLGQARSRSDPGEGSSEGQRGFARGDADPREGGLQGSPPSKECRPADRSARSFPRPLFASHLARAGFTYPRPVLSAQAEESSTRFRSAERRAPGACRYRGRFSASGHRASSAPGRIASAKRRRQPRG